MMALKNEDCVRPTISVDAASPAGQDTVTWARSYQAIGLKLCRIARGSKGPRDLAWEKNPRCADEFVGYGVGVIHALSGTCAIDIDDLVEAEAWFDVRGVDIKALLHADDAVQIISGRANRAKLIYRLPESVEPLATTKVRNTHGKMVIEFRCASKDGAGMQDVLPPTVHPDTGNSYRWGGAGCYTKLPPLPEELLRVWNTHLDGEEKPADGLARAILSGAIIEGGRNDTLFRLAGDMARLGLGAESIESVLASENQSRCQPPLSKTEVHAIVRSALKSSQGAKSYLAEVVGQASLHQLATASVAASKSEVDEVIGSAHMPDQLPGVLAEIASWSLQINRMKQPTFALAVALSACGAILARDFTGASGAHTNLYCVAVGPTACGKEGAIDAVKRLVSAYDASRLAGVPASDSGVLAAVMRNPAGIFVMDELGEILSGVFDPKAMSYQARIGTAFMDLYTKGGKAYIGKEYGNQNKDSREGRARVDVYSPCPSIWGATTATTLYKPLNAATINSGFVPRLLVFRAPDAIPMPNRDQVDAPIPDSVVRWMDRIRQRVAAHARNVTEAEKFEVGYHPIRVPYSSEALELFYQAQERLIQRRNAMENEVESNMLSRLVENTGRVALIIALAADPDSEVVAAENFLLAEAIVTRATSVFMADIRANVFDSDHAKLEKKVLDKIVEYYAEHQKPITEGKLGDRCRPYGAARLADRKAVIEALIAQEKVIKTPNRNHGSFSYWPAQPAA